MIKPISRRQLLLGSGSCALSCLTFPYLKAESQTEAEPHFALQIILPGGLDAHYVFDARPLEMTERKIIQNYFGEPPAVWTGSNGYSSLVTSLFDPFKPIKDYFTIINGVVMDPTFEGHDQSMALWYTGSPFGGEFYLPHLNTTGLPLDYVEVGKRKVSVPLSNSAKGVSFSNQSVKNLLKNLASSDQIDANSGVFKHALSRMAAIGNLGTGRFSGGSRTMASSLEMVPSLAGKFLSMNMEHVGGEEYEDMLLTLRELFAAGITRSASLVIETDYSPTHNLDTHDVASARDTPTTLRMLIPEIVNIFETLRNTPFSADASMLDVTTVVVASEFGRTMRQDNVPFEITATDHNPLSNTILIGGKGIRCGQIIGATDFQSASSMISKAHLGFDPHLIKAMGKPFDFDNALPREDLPESYKPDDYITSSSVVNTVLKILGAGQEHFRLSERNGSKARTIDCLLA